MAYPPSSTVSHFKVIFSISNVNDWLIADGVFFVIRCIILLSNKTEKLMKWSHILLLLRSVVHSHEEYVDLRMIEINEVRWHYFFLA